MTTRKDKNKISTITEPVLLDDGELNPDFEQSLSDAIENMPETYIRLSGDSEWNTTKDNWTFTGDIVSYFAQCAVSFSPYTAPDNLVGVLEQVELIFKPLEDSGGMFEISLCTVNELLHEHIIPLQQVQEWNVPKNGDHRVAQFSSRYSSKPDPDDDFIDLSALAHGVCLALRQTRRERKEFDKKFEEDYKNSLQ